MKFELIGPVVSEEKMFENVDGGTDGQRIDWYTISSPMSYRLRWAKNQKRNVKVGPPMKKLFWIPAWQW